MANGVHGVSMLAIRALIAAIERSGVRSAVCLPALGLSIAQVGDDAARVSFHAYREMVRIALDLTRDPALGLHMGEAALAPTAFDVIGLLAQQARTIRSALATFDAYALLVTDGRRFELRERDDGATIRMLLPAGGPAESRFFAELATSALQQHFLVAFFGARARALRVHFSFPPPRHRHEYTRIFQGAEAFDEPFTGISIERAWLDRELTQQSSELRTLLKARADLLRDRLARGTGATDRVTRWLAVQEPGGKPLMRAAARALGTSTRSLRRALQREDTDFTRLCEAARAQHAMRLLSAGLSSVQEIAYELGFTTHAAFTRAFKRWTGRTPSAYREHSGGTPGPRRQVAGPCADIEAASRRDSRRA